MDSDSDLNSGAYHKTSAFRLPANGELVVGPNSGAQYKFGYEIAQGNFGHVLTCTDDWERPLVAKVLKPIGRWQETEQQALTEALAMAVARSPTIVHVFEVFAWHGAFILISERCHMSVRELMLDPKIDRGIWLRPLANSVLNALHWMHTNDLAHCDVHLGNIFVQFTPDALLPDDVRSSATTFKLGDLGLARPIARNAT